LKKKILNNSFKEIKMDSNKKKARLAGLLYLLMAVSGPIGLLIVPSKIIVDGNVAATTQNIVTHEMLFRIGIVSNLVCQISFIFLVLALNRLFNGVNEKYAKLMVSLVIVAVPIAVLNELNNVAALVFADGAGFLNPFNPEQLNALATVFVQLHEKGTIIASFFWGLWLFPFGVLVVKSGFIPKILGILLIVGCFTYVVDSSLAILFPKFRELITGFLLLPLSLGEISMVLWLLIKGVKVQKPVISVSY